MLQPGRKYSSQSGYRYGFNGKENDNEVKGEGDQQDYGMRIYDPRLGKFLSVDPLTKKYQMLTPYQFAANSPIDGIDQDGLEWMKYDSKNTSTIVFGKSDYKNNAIIKKEYEYAMKAHMNIVVADNLKELNVYLDEKGKKTYANMIFTGHGGYKNSTISLIGSGYDANSLEAFKSELVKVANHINKNGTIVLFACFQATPKYDEVAKTKDKNGNTVETQIHLNGQDLVDKLATVTNRQVLGNAAESPVLATEFSGVPLSSHNDDVNAPYQNVNNTFEGIWTLNLPNTGVNQIGNVTMDDRGNYTITSPPIISQIKKIFEKIASFLKPHAKK